MLNGSDQHIFTVGHSDNPIAGFIDLLRAHRVTAVADVRSSPFSRFNPQFNRNHLKSALHSAQILYVPLGEELGARRIEPDCYVGGKARYELIAKLSLFREGLRRVRQGADKYRIALMCAEKDPITCHRTILVCRHLKPFGLPISHILQNGNLETTDAMENRLLDVAGNGGVDLFASDLTSAIENAYDVQGDRIAYMKSAMLPE